MELARVTLAARDLSKQSNPEGFSADTQGQPWKGLELVRKLRTAALNRGDVWRGMGRQEGEDQKPQENKHPLVTSGSDCCPGGPPPNWPPRELGP